MMAVVKVVSCGNCDSANKATTPTMTAKTFRVDKYGLSAELSPFCRTKVEVSVRVTLGDSTAYSYDDFIV